MLTANLHRRHLTREQRREVVANLRAQGWSLRRIARRLGVDPMTVHHDLRGVENSTPQTITGADGKQYPATKPASLVEEPKAEAPVQVVSSDNLRRGVTFVPPARRPRWGKFPTCPRCTKLYTCPGIAFATGARSCVV
ncbi:MAG: helix-turn-helix domain-containing protein [Firmicutes bacterium]|nr:helix-turn-helix domain-containing protein [Bacillota bacterium]